MNKIIFLSGCSSAGKTSLVKAIQHLSEEPWLTFGIDTFIQAMPSKYLGFSQEAKQGFQFITEHDEKGKPVTRIETGPVAKKIVRSIPHVIKLLSDEGHNIIVDEIILNEEWLKIYADALFNYKVYLIGVKCDLTLMEEREFLRGDRVLGLARWQNKVYQLPPEYYDLQINTNQTSSFANAEKILQFLKEKEPRPFAKNN